VADEPAKLMQLRNRGPVISLQAKGTFVTAPEERHPAE
jgi:hypothetical protein